MTRDERGLSESVQWAVLAPVLLMVLLGALQVALGWHARNVAFNAAAAAAEAEAAYGSRPGDGRAAAQGVLRAGGLDGASVVVLPVGMHVRATVSGRAPLVVAELGIGRVEQSVTVPRERVR